MSTVGHSSTDATEILFPTARIDAQDEPYILPLREYLESHGVEVSVNRATRVPPVYHLVAGDATFVKETFSRMHAPQAKKLGIVLGGGKKQEEFSVATKIVLADPVPMSAADVLSVFTYLFAEGKKHLDLRRQHETRTLHELSHAGADANGDAARVGSIIADIFGEEATEATRKAGAKKHRKKRRAQAWMLALLITAGFVIIPFLWYGICVGIGGIAVISGAAALRNGNSAISAWDGKIADYWIHQGAFLIGVVSEPLSWVGEQDSIRGQQRLISFLGDATAAESEAQSLTGVAGRVAAGLLNQVNATSTGTTAAADITNLRISLYTLGNTLGLAQAELTTILADRTFPFTIPIVFQKGTTAVGDLTAVRQSAGDMDKLLSLFLSLAGFNGPRTYLILFQNSMELRPTGGFIGSVGVASFADGRLSNLDIEDVYTFDGQLKGHVDPPTPIRDILSQEHWYLRDSNWDPDFQESGARAAWFYEKETGSSVDGVIGISTPFITSLLAATGPITLSDYHDTITANNFYGKAIYYTQNDFFPGSTQKKDFLGSLGRALLSQVTTGKNVNTTILFHAITEALSGHDIMMEFTDNNLESLATYYGWAGKIPPDVGCTGANRTTCIFDPLIPVEANLSVNKVNYFVARSLDRTITIHADGTRAETVTVDFHNSAGAADKNLPYRTYIRFVLPPAATVENIIYDGQPVPARVEGSPLLLPYAEMDSVASGLSTLGVAVDVPAGTQKKLTISYTEHTPMSFGTSGAVLDAFIAKQPGISGESTHTTIMYPSGWTAGVEDANNGTAPDFIAKTGQLGYNTILTRDSLTRIQFTK